MSAKKGYASQDLEKILFFMKIFFVQVGFTIDVLKEEKHFFIPQVATKELTFAQEMAAQL